MINEQTSTAISNDSTRIHRLFEGKILQPLKINNIKRTDNETFKSNDLVLSDSAVKQLLNEFHIKRKILDDAQGSKWEVLERALHNLKGDMSMMTLIDNRNSSVSGFYDITKTSPDGSISFTRGIDALNASILSSKREINYHGMEWNEETCSLDTSLRFDTTDIDIFNDNTDIWKFGCRISMGFDKISICPFFLRLVCANGAIATKMGKSQRINGYDMNPHRIRRFATKFFDGADYSFITDQCKLLASCNASLNEVNIVRKSIPDEMADEILPVEEILGAYEDDDVFTRPKRWLQTANSNINAYDLFNKITYVTSRRDEYCLDDRSYTKLTMNASRMLCEEPDLLYKAPDPFIVANN